MGSYKRVLLKLSGEALKGKVSDDIFDKDMLKELVEIIKDIVNSGVELGIVVGGGNIFRGRVCQEFNLERIEADYMGMTATNINGMMLEDILNVSNINAVCFSELPVAKCMKKYCKCAASKALKEGKVVIFAGGTGKPLFSTDTAAALKANDIKAEVILAGKHGTDGVYSDDPSKNKNAVKFDTISYDEFIDKNLTVLDVASIKICKEHDIQVKVFNMDDLKNITKVVNGEDIGTTIRKE